MNRRKNGYLLLTLLVITGLSSQVMQPSLTYKERTTVTASLKSGRSALHKRLNALSTAQMQFVTAEGHSIARHCARLAQLQRNLLAGIKYSQRGESLNIPLPSEKELKKAISDHECLTVPEPGIMDAEAIRKLQTELVRLAKTTTSNLHAHRFQSCIGTMDGYRALQAAALAAEKACADIDLILANPRFPN